MNPLDKLLSDIKEAWRILSAPRANKEKLGRLLYKMEDQIKAVANCGDCPWGAEPANCKVCSEKKEVAK